MDGVFAMKAILLVSLAACLWGTVGVADRLMTGAPRLDPTLVGLSRTALGAALPPHPCRLPRDRPARPGKRCRSTSFCVRHRRGRFQTCLFAAFDRVGVTITVAVTVAGPAALVSIGDAAWNRRLPEPVAAVAIAVAIAGLLVALAARRQRAGQHRLAGRRPPSRRRRCLLRRRRLRPLAQRQVSTPCTPPASASSSRLDASPSSRSARGGADPDDLAALPARDTAILAYTGVVATGGAYLAFVAGMGLSRSPTAGSPRR